MVVAGDTHVYTVGLAAPPAGPVTVSSDDPTVATVGQTGSPGSRAVVFTPGNWQTPKRVTGAGAGPATLRR